MKPGSRILATMLYFGIVYGFAAVFSLVALAVFTLELIAIFRDDLRLFAAPTATISWLLVLLAGVTVSWAKRHQQRGEYEIIWVSGGFFAMSLLSWANIIVGWWAPFSGTILFGVLTWACIEATRGIKPIFST